MSDRVVRARRASRLGRQLGLAVSLFGLSAAALEAQEAPPPPRPLSGPAAGVFRDFADRVVRLQVVETGSAAKSGVGSGFFVSDAGHLVTNYHVISRLATDPGRYRAELTDRAGVTRPVKVVSVDVIHDLALLSSDYRPAAHFSLDAAGEMPPQGERLYSLGHPHDLGLSIVEGTHNGLLEHTLYPRIHFTGAINPGMSGGPTITGDGRVVGVNVATAGNEVSFLVPVDRAAAIAATGFAVVQRTDSGGFLAEIGRQLQRYQDDYLGKLLDSSAPAVTIGPYQLPTRPAPFFKCWADAERDRETPYETVEHTCNTEDEVFLSASHSSGTIELRHQVITSSKLDAFRFFSLYSTTYQESDGFLRGDEEDVTAFECRTRNVRTTSSHRFRAQLCVRRYLKLAGLYDAVLRVAALDAPVLDGMRTGLVSSLTLSGASFANIERLVDRYLERVTWRR